MKNLKLGLLFFLLFTLSIYASEKNIIKELKINENESVMIQEFSDYHVVNTIRNMETNLWQATLYDFQGNEIFKTSFNDKRKIRFATFIEEYRIFLFAYHGQISEGKDVIEAININSGNSIWKTELPGLTYELSPNRKFLIPVDFTEFESQGRLEILDIETGTKFTPGLNSPGLPANWVDNDRIIYAERIYEKNEDYSNSEYQQLTSERRELRNSLILIRRKLNKGQISEQEFQSENNSIEKRLDEIKTLLKPYHTRLVERGTKRIRPNPQKETGLKIVIFNLKSKSIEKELLLTDNSGENILYKSYMGEIGYFHVINEEICLFGRRDEPEEFTFFISLTKDLTASYIHSFDKMRVLNKITNNNNTYFRVSNNQTYKISI